ncbi:MAG: Smr/MutS family protein [Pseudomonadota bacterium]
MTRRRRGLSADDRAAWDAVARTARRAEESATRAPEPPESGTSPPPDKAAPAHNGSSHAAEPAGPAIAPRAGKVLRRGAAHDHEAGAPVQRPAWPGAAGPAGRNAGWSGPASTPQGQSQGQPHGPGHAHGDRLPGPVGRPEAGLDRRTAERLRRGDRLPDDRLDLHGMTAERAHAALDRFIAAALARGLRMVLVITGKGGRRAPEDAPWLPEGRGVLRDALPRWLRQGPNGRRIVGIYQAHQRHGGAGAFYVYLRKPR